MLGSDLSSNNKRIAKNTLLLYFRMAFLLLVSLYTSRVVLATLGKVDYGLFSVVGGVIALLSFLTSSMSVATSRFITFALGTNNINDQKKVFSTALQIHFLIAFLILLVGETLGLWFVLNKMTIPENRLTASIWVYQCSILTSMIGVISMPYNSTIIAHEKMSAFAYISIYEALAKLLIVYLLLVSSVDKLILYSVLYLLVQFSVRIVYGIYCGRHFSETRYVNVKDAKLFKEMIGFAGWSLYGNGAVAISNHGSNLLLNTFFNPIVNAAYGIAMQVRGITLNFAFNFQTAINPQIIKSYAGKDMQTMYKLIDRSTRLTFMLLFIISLPILLETQPILDFWLKDAPDFSAIFLQLALIAAIIDITGNSLSISAAATGRIKYYHLIIGTLFMLIVPISYLFLKMGKAPYFIFVVDISICLIIMFTRLFIVHKLIGLSIVKYMNSLYTIFKVLIFSLPIPFIAKKLFNTDYFIDVILVCFVSVLSVIISSYFFGLERHEREFITSKFKNKFRTVFCF